MSNQSRRGNGSAGSGKTVPVVRAISALAHVGGPNTMRFLREKMSFDIVDADERD